MTAKQILDEIKPSGAEGYRNILANHGVTGPCYGVKVEELKKIQKRVKKHIHTAPNGARKAMNNFLISVGTYVESLSETAVKLGGAIGPVSVDVGNTACKIPFAPEYIAKAAKRGSIGKKRKSAKC